MNAIQESIKSLEAISNTLDAYTRSRKDAQPEYVEYLEAMSWEMYKTANDLRRVGYLCDGVEDTMRKSMKKGFYRDSMWQFVNQIETLDRQSHYAEQFTEEEEEEEDLNGHYCPYCCSGCVDCLL